MVSTKSLIKYSSRKIVTQKRELARSRARPHRHLRHLDNGKVVMVNPEVVKQMQILHAKPQFSIPRKIMKPTPAITFKPKVKATSKMSVLDRKWRNFGDVDAKEYGGLYIRKTGPDEYDVIKTYDMKNMLPPNEFKEWMLKENGRYWFDANYNISGEDLLDDDGLAEFIGLKDSVFTDLSREDAIIALLSAYNPYYGGDSSFYNDWDDGLQNELGIEGLDWEDWDDK